jgi:TRAP-type mannitol/chloroaromatic compound transport system permease small subunit
LKKILKVIDSISDHTGRVVAWLALALVLILVFEVVARWGFNSPTIWAHLTSQMMGGTLVVMGLAYAHVHRKHLRIDIIYRTLSPRVKVILDVCFFLVFMVPVLYVFVLNSAEWAVQSWVMGEVRDESWWYPPAAPFRTVYLLGWCTFTLQCLARFFRDFYFAVRNKPYD